MKSQKKIISILLLIAMLLGMLEVPVQAADKLTTTTTTSGGTTAKWSYELNEDEKVINLVCTNPTELIGKVEIPGTIDGKTVLTLGSYCLRGAKGMTEVTIPNTITTIGAEAFSSCTGLKNINLPDSVITLKCTGWNTGVFYGCTGLKNVKLSKNITEISDGTFCRCSGLQHIELGDNTTTIGYEAFSHCDSLKSIIIKDNVSSIHKNAFNSTNTKNITIYGNKGSVAEQYANENKIKFDLISNYGKQDAGSDISAPTVTEIKVTSPKAGTYTTGQKVTIQVVFSEKITATTMPTLKVKFGTGAEKSVTTGTLSGNTITYTYTIASGDKGQLLTSSLTGGDVKDAAGNAAKLTCPIISGNAIVANAVTAGGNNNSGTGSGTNNGASTGTNNGGTTGTNNGGNSGTTNKPSTSNDPTTAKTELPKTGESIAIFGVVAVLLAGGVFYFVKVRKYSDIK